MAIECKRYRLTRLFFCLTAMLLGGACHAAGTEDNRPPPNILLIVAEDLSGRVGAFGDAVARTPYIDRLAQQGVRYPNAFTVAGVCAPSRSGLITGVYPISMGTHQMRTGQGVPGSEVERYEAVPPPEVKAFPELLRRAGYATANFAKKDYQFGEPFTVWDVDAGNLMSPLDPALWRKLPQGKPFFAMVNLMATHESRLASADGKFAPEWQKFIRATIELRKYENIARVTDPNEVPVPPYYPDTPMVRRSIAQHYDNIHYMDAQVGEILAELEQDGLSDNTIVIWTTDHGDALPRAKRAVYDSGIKVPMVIRYPDGRGGGTVRSDLVSFVDLAPTILKLAGAPVPDFIQGEDFLDDSPRQYIYAARDRMDETPDRQRAVRGARFHYIRNYMAELAYFRPLVFRDMFPVMRELWAGHDAGTLHSASAVNFTAPRPADELYDTEADPDEVHNLAGDAQYADVLAHLQKELDQHLAAVGDEGSRPEIEMLAEMWPGLVQPQTAAPVPQRSFTDDGRQLVTLSSATEGASIGYRIDGEDWQLYTRPLALDSGTLLESKAIRYGFRESAVSRIEVAAGN